MEMTEATAASRGVLTYIRSRGRNLKPQPLPLAPTCSRSPPQESSLGNASHAAPSEAPAPVANDAEFPTHKLSFNLVEAKDADKGTVSLERNLKATPKKPGLKVDSPKQSAVKIEPVTPEKGLPKRARKNANETTEIGKACEQKCLLLQTYAKKRKTRPTSNYEDANLTVADSLSY